MASGPPVIPPERELRTDRYLRRAGELVLIGGLVGLVIVSSWAMCRLDTRGEHLDRLVQTRLAGTPAPAP